MSQLRWIFLICYITSYTVEFSVSPKASRASQGQCGRVKCVTNLRPVEESLPDPAMLVSLLRSSGGAHFAQMVN